MNLSKIFYEEVIIMSNKSFITDMLNVNELDIESITTIFQ